MVVTMDVVGLYPSIPMQNGITAVVEKLNKHKKEIDLLGLEVEDIERLTRFVLTNNYFKFGETTYRQTHGVAMGNHLAPPLAIVFMDKLETSLLATAVQQPKFYDRYVDDIIMGWMHGKGALTEFVDHCNSQHPSIRFT